MLKNRFESALTSWVLLARRYWLAVLLLALLSVVAGLEYVSSNLGINTDTADMISRQLDWRQRDIEFDRQFPQFRNTLVIVIDADSPDLAQQAARKLQQRLKNNTELFSVVRYPGHSMFFERNALLYLDEGDLERLIEDLGASQPLLERLRRDPSLFSIARLLKEALNAREAFDVKALNRFSLAFAKAIEAQIEGRFFQLSWQRLMSAQDVRPGVDRQILEIVPRLDFSELFPASEAIAQIRQQAAQLGLDAEHGTRVRITGGLAMSDEELRSVSRGAGQAAVLALVCVFLVLALGLGSLRLVLCCLLTLLVGLLWTAVFAAAAVGQLNMISIAFAVLYIGLGVDYAIHFGLRYRELRLQAQDHDAALAHSAREVGGALSLCALTTGLGFFAFVPTDFAGVSELGLIAGVGMFISLAATLTLMPALLTLIQLRVIAVNKITLPGGERLGLLLYRRQLGVLVVFVLLGLLALLGLPNVYFDSNPLNLRDRNGEAVSTYRVLVAQNNNWSLDALFKDPLELDTLRKKIEALPSVKQTRALSDFVPGEQMRKLQLIDDLALMLGPGGAGIGPASSTAASARELLDLSQLLNSRGQSTPQLQRLNAALQRFRPTLESALQEPDQKPDLQAQRALVSVQESVLSALPEQLRRLRAGLDADVFKLENLPADLRRDWQTANGSLRLQINSSVDLNQPANLKKFVDEVHRVVPQAVGTPVIHLEAANVVVGAFQEAFLLALACIGLLLWLLLRRLQHVMFILVPLLVAGVFTVALMAAFGLAFNFANVIALPLLLGIGVDSGIHMLARARLGVTPQTLVASVTARAVLVSALTTLLSFGNLAFSAHPGTASMGILLSIGMLATLMCTLLLLPALFWRFNV